MRLTFIAVLLFVMGCGSTGVIPVGSRVHPEKASNCQLDVYSSRQDVEREFEPVCLISSESGSALLNDRSTEGRMSEVRSKACRCGADAIVITGLGRTATRVGEGYSRAQVSVEAIVYK